jgi:[acyl-carrier-protein] S-malonyltransferase
MRSEKPLIRSFAMDIAADREAWADYRVPTLDEVSLIGRCLAVAVCTRNHNFDDEQYRRGVIEPYNEIKALQDFLELEQRLPDPAGLDARPVAAQDDPRHQGDTP